MVEHMSYTWSFCKTAVLEHLFFSPLRTALLPSPIVRLPVYPTLTVVKNADIIYTIPVTGVTSRMGPIQGIKEQGPYLLASGNERPMPPNNSPKLEKWGEMGPTVRVLCWFVEKWGQHCVKSPKNHVLWAGCIEEHAQGKMGGNGGKWGKWREM